MFTSKFPSPLTNPAIQLGSNWFGEVIIGLLTTLNLGNSDFNFSDKAPIPPKGERLAQ